jgi:hypothetical protein
LVLKAHQPARLAEVARLFDHPPPGAAFAGASSRRTPRGRRAVRQLTVSSTLAA